MCQRVLVAVALVGWMFCATSSGHAQTTLRQKSDAQVVLEVRLLTVSEALFERLGLDFEVVKSADANVKQPQEAAEPLKLGPDSPPQTLSPQTVGLAFLSDIQVFQLLEAAQGDRKTNIVQSPRLMVTSGQAGTLDLTQTQYFLTGVNILNSGQFRPKNEPFKIGLAMTVTPRVSADGRFIQLAVALKHTELASKNVPLIP